MFVLGLFLIPAGIASVVFGIIQKLEAVKADDSSTALALAGMIMIAAGILALIIGFKNYRYKKNRIYTVPELSLASVEVAALVCAQLIKTTVFYIYVGIGLHTVTLVLSSAFLMCLYLIIGAFNKERPPLGYAVGMYCFTSIAMFIDTLYFRQFTKIPSFMALKQTGFVGDVGESVFSLLSFANLFYIIDLFALIFYFAYIRKRILKKLDGREIISYDTVKKRFVHAAKRVTPVLFCLVAAITVLTDFTFTNLRNEFLAFHVVDASRTAFGISESEKEYQGSLKTDYVDSPLHGIAQGRNLIVIQVESLQSFVVGRDYNGKTVTPNINKLIDSSIYFDNYYFQTGGGNTSDAEFTVNNSLLAPEFESGYMKYAANTFYGMPWILKENGYKTATAFHGYSGYFWNRSTAYPNQGFDKFYSGEAFNMKLKIGMGISDEEFLQQTVTYMKTLEQPYYAFVITLSSHFPFTMPVANPFDLFEEDKGTCFADYIAAINYTDACIGSFIESLKANGMYDNSVIAMYGDHFALSINDEEISRTMKNFMGYEYNYEEFLNVPCMIHIPGVEAANGKKISVASGHVDLMPTLLDVLGCKSDNMIMVGQNLLSAESGIVYPQASVERSSFIDDNDVYICPQNNIVSNILAYDKKTSVTLDPASCRERAQNGLKLFSDCTYLLDNNLIAEFLQRGRDATLGNG